MTKQESIRLMAAAATMLLGIHGVFAKPQNPETGLRQTFENPPANAKPMMRWWWFGVAVEKQEIRRELEQMKADGIGGAELAFVYPQAVDDSKKGIVNEQFLSSAMLENVQYASQEAHRLGLRLDVTMGSGWPYGGPATSLKEAAEHLRVEQIPVPAGSTQFLKPRLADGESVVSTALVNGASDHWIAKGATEIGALSGSEFAASDVDRTALVFIASPTGQVVKRAAVGAEGWVLDPFSHDAVATHLKAVGEPLVKAFGDAPPYAVFSDSLEAYGADWSPELPAEFLKRRGYDLLPHLPELVEGKSEESLKVRHDWGRTLTELIDENYLTQIDAWAIAHRTRFRSQSYGEPAVSFSSQRLVNLSEGEGPHLRSFSTLRWASSANHVFGRNITSAEAFTWLHSPVFSATPLDMKVEADLHFVLGVNQIIGHGWPYSPPEAGEPGWSLYAAGAFNDHNPWHPVMPDVTRYIQRVSWMLRQGEASNQVAMLLPTDDAWAAFSPGNVSITEEMNRLVPAELVGAILAAGYNVDFIDADAIERVGIHYPMLVLPPTDRIPLATLQRIERYVASGGKAIAFGRAPSVDANGHRSGEITSLARRLFDPSKLTLAQDATGLRSAMQRALTPDVQMKDSVSGAGDESGALAFIRRKLPSQDIYFVVNTTNRPLKVQGTFATTHRLCERWDADDGSVKPCGSSPDVGLDFAAYESALFVFSDEATLPVSLVEPRKPATLVDLSSDWDIDFVSLGRTVAERTLSDWTADDATRFYSGEAVYRRKFKIEPGADRRMGRILLELDGGVSLASPEDAGGPERDPAGLKAPGMRAWYDPPIRCAAIVLVNGKRVGALWHPPYRLDLTDFVKVGKGDENDLEIRVFNTALNAWSALPAHDYGPLNAMYGERFHMQDLDKVKPQSSGLLGKVRLVRRAVR